MLQCRTLPRAEIIDTYNVHMKNDFPEDELKPLTMILKSLDREQYICYGVFSDDVLCGYAYFAIIVDNNKKYYLLDYFATVSDMRGKGIGSAFLNMLYEHMTDVEMVICETENPKGTIGDEFYIRNRRIGFYLRNKYIDTGVTASIFGVDYILLELDLGNKHTKDEIRVYYSKLYRSFLPEKLYNKFMKI